jgi:hypothetical protein
MTRSFRSWLRAVVARGSAATSRGRKSAGRQPLVRPHVDPLEDRTLLNTYTVNNLADSGAGSLRQAILDANGDGGANQIVFAPGMQGTIALTGGELDIADDMTIAGPGAGVLAVSGSDAGRVFAIAAGVTAEIDGLTITHGRAEQGGGLDNAGDLILRACTLSHNRAVGVGHDDAQGGAIFNEEGANLTVTTSTLSDNLVFSTPDSTGPGGNAHGGSLYNLGHVAVTHSQFLRNQALTAGGSNPGLVAARGGAIWNGLPSTLSAATLVVTQSSFMGNEANGGAGSSGFAAGVGGAIANSQATATIIGSTFAGNRAVGRSSEAGGSFGRGGALFNLNQGDCAVVGTSFIGNEALGGTGGGSAQGGAIFNLGGPPGQGSLTLTNVTVNGNAAIGGDGGDGVTMFAYGAGGGIFTQGAPLVLTSSTVNGNLARGGDHANNNPDGTGTDVFNGSGQGGGIYYNGGVGSGLTIDHSTIAGNQALGGNSAQGVGGPADGGAITWGNAGYDGGDVIMRDSMVTSNSAVGGTGAARFRGGIAYGGGLGDDGDPFLATNITVAGNSVIGGPGGAGAPGGTGFGGGLTVDFDTAAAVITGSSFTGNLAQGGPGGAGADGGNGEGAAIGVGTAVLFYKTSDHSALTLSDTLIANNAVQGGAGSAGHNGGDGLGGGLYAATGTTVLLQNVQVLANEADGGAPGNGGQAGQGLGGGVYIAAGGMVCADADTIITGNHASTSDDDVYGGLCMDSPHSRGNPRADAVTRLFAIPGVVEAIVGDLGGQ